MDIDDLPREHVGIFGSTIQASANPSDIGKWHFLVEVSDEHEQFFGTYHGPCYSTAILEAERLAAERGFEVFDFVGELA